MDEFQFGRCSSSTMSRISVNTRIDSCVDVVRARAASIERRRIRPIAGSGDRHGEEKEKERRTNELDEGCEMNE